MGFSYDLLSLFLRQMLSFCNNKLENVNLLAIWNKNLVLIQPLRTTNTDHPSHVNNQHFRVVHLTKVQWSSAHTSNIPWVSPLETTFTRRLLNKVLMQVQHPEVTIRITSPSASPSKENRKSKENRTLAADKEFYQCLRHQTVGHTKGPFTLCDLQRQPVFAYYGPCRTWWCSHSPIA